MVAPLAKPGRWAVSPRSGPISELRMSALNVYIIDIFRCTLVWNERFLMSTAMLADGAGDRRKL